MKFPAAALLGLSMNVFDPWIPLDASQIGSRIQKQNRILTFDQQHTRPVKIDGQTYHVPKAIEVSEHVAGTHEIFVTFPSKDDLATAIKADPSLLPSVFSLGGGATSVRAAVEKRHYRDVQYTYYTYRQSKYQANLTDCGGHLNNHLLLEGIRQLPTPFNGDDKDVVEKYTNFFMQHGTHVVTAAEYGSIFQLHVWGSDENSAVNEAWVEDVKADYKGIPSGGGYDHRINETEQYKEYRQLSNMYASVLGGDPGQVDTFLRQLDWESFQDWADTAGENILPSTFYLTELWELMRASDDIEVVRYALDVYEAFEWLLATSDW
ncbi:hypothetical protein V5O48_003433 [Marasmius crinis-equi]|uniref:MACPF domain-containing protein n=1 Tax=Marasmius crinis-equi TaxID=585013 RepID=A0ABR3FSY6_9AGAR